MTYDFEYMLGHKKDQYIILAESSEGEISVHTITDKSQFQNQLQIMEEFEVKILFKQEAFKD